MLSGFNECRGATLCGDRILVASNGALTLWTLPPRQSVGLVASDPQQIASNVSFPGTRSCRISALPTSLGTTVVIQPHLTPPIVYHFDRTWKQLCQPKTLHSGMAVAVSSQVLVCSWFMLFCFALLSVLFARFVTASLTQYSCRH